MTKPLYTWSANFVAELELRFEDDAETRFYIELLLTEILLDNRFVISNLDRLNFVLLSGLLLGSYPSSTVLSHSLFVTFVAALKVLCDDYQSFLVNKQHLEDYYGDSHDD